MPQHWLEYVLFACYIVVGPVAWGLFGLAMIRGRARLSIFRRVVPIETGPAVTILIPAKDEGERIRACIESALNQRYDNFNVIAINDRSTDDTGAILDEIASAHPKLRVVHIAPGALPTGWTGKCNALHSSVPHADGEWLLFVDSDVVLQPDALSTTLGAAGSREYDLLSLLPRVESGGFWEALLVPLAGTAINAMYTTALTNSDHRKPAFANGQFLLVRRSVYESVGGHQRVRDQFTEDVELARLYKSLGKRVRLGWHRNLFCVRMYSSLPGIVRGWGRNFYAVAYGSPWRTMLASVAVIVCGLSVYAAILWGLYRAAHPINRFGGSGWFAVAAIHWSLLTACLVLIYGWSGNKKRYALLWPIGAVMLLRIFARSLVMCATGKVEWRGTNYTHRVERSYGVSG